MDRVPRRRQHGAMSDSPYPTPLDRINLRLPAETFEVIDRARAARPGHVSRNTWITEAVEDKLAREAASLPELAARQHG